MTDTHPSPEEDSTLGTLSIVEVLDEREPLAESAIRLIESAFRLVDRQPLGELRSEIGEKRMGFVNDFHLLAARSGEEVVGVVGGVYLTDVNAGFITYLTVSPEHRGQELAPALRGSLVEIFRSDARRAGLGDLAWVVGEVRTDNNWLRRLVEAREVVVFDLDYFAPIASPRAGAPEYLLYRQLVGDVSPTVPAHEVQRLLYAIFRRGYRIRYPLENASFRTMLAHLEGRKTVGEHSDFRTP